MAEDGGCDAEVGGEGVGGAPEEQNGDGEVEDDGDGEDLFFEGRGVGVDVGDVDFGWVEGFEEGGARGRGKREVGLRGWLRRRWGIGKCGFWRSEPWLVELEF